MVAELPQSIDTIYVCSPRAGSTANPDISIQQMQSIARKCIALDHMFPLMHIRIQCTPCHGAMRARTATIPATSDACTVSNTHAPTYGEQSGGNTALRVLELAAERPPGADHHPTTTTSNNSTQHSTSSTAPTAHLGTLGGSSKSTTAFAGVRLGRRSTTLLRCTRAGST